MKIIEKKKEINGLIYAFWKPSNSLKSRIKKNEVKSWMNVELKLL